MGGKESRSARGRIAAKAAAHGWSEMHGDVASNVRVYQRGGRTVIVGYRPSGGVTGATRMYGGASAPSRKKMPVDELTNLDHDKAGRVLSWLSESDRAVRSPITGA